MRRARSLVYDVVLEPSDDGGYTVYVPTLKGCISEGDTEEEALENIKDAIHVWRQTWEDIVAARGSLLRQEDISR